MVRFCFVPFHFLPFRQNDSPAVQSAHYSYCCTNTNVLLAVDSHAPHAPQIKTLGQTALQGGPMAAISRCLVLLTLVNLQRE